MRSRVRSAHVAWRAEWALLLALSGSALAGSASAAPPDQRPPSPSAPPATSPACAEEGGQPPPAEAKCVARTEPADTLSWRLLPRAALAIPRLLFRTVTEVASFGSEVEDHYDFADRVRVLEGTPEFSIYPAVLYDTGSGPAAGVGVARNNLFGGGETLSARGIYGGRFRQLYEGEASTGARFRDVRPAIQVAYETNNHYRFYGVGNGDIADPNELLLPLNAQLPGPAVRSFYRLEQFRVQYLVDGQITPTWHARISQLWRARDISAGGDDKPFVDQVFAPATLVGFGPLLVDTYTEFQLLWDSREALRDDTPRALPGAGFRMQTWTGLQHEFAAPHSTFARLGIDLHSFIDLYRGNRILHLRARAALAAGGLDDIPFVDLPQLGGSLLLRGYDTGRFHGALSLLGSAEYRYPVQERAAAYMFVDTGRVFTHVGDVRPRGFLDSRVGFGIGLQMFTASKALFRVQLASSIDGGLFFHLSLNTTDELNATL